MMEVLTTDLVDDASPESAREQLRALAGVVDALHASHLAAWRDLHDRLLAEPGAEVEARLLRPPVLPAEAARILRELREPSAEPEVPLGKYRAAKTGAEPTSDFRGAGSTVATNQVLRAFGCVHATGLGLVLAAAATGSARCFMLGWLTWALIWSVGTAEFFAPRGVLVYPRPAPGEPRRAVEGHEVTLYPRRVSRLMSTQVTLDSEERGTVTFAVWVAVTMMNQIAINIYTRRSDAISLSWLGEHIPAWLEFARWCGYILFCPYVGWLFFKLRLYLRRKYRDQKTSRAQDLLARFLQLLFIQLVVYVEAVYNVIRYGRGAWAFAQLSWQAMISLSWGWFMLILVSDTGGARGGAGLVLDARRGLIPPYRSPSAKR